jgi:hypothetical protein
MNRPHPISNANQKEGYIKFANVFPSQQHRFAKSTMCSVIKSNDFLKEQ